jgi:spore maturation protein CgeB
MRIAIFTHSLISDWNHGNAHFLRGIAAELIARGHELRIFEPEDGWSLRNLIEQCGPGAVDAFHSAFPLLRSEFYSSEFYTAAIFDPESVLCGTDVVLVHEWNDHRLVARIGEYRARHPECLLFFHDTHHRSVTDPAAMAAYDLRHYDGVLAYGSAIRDIYLASGWTRRAWTWHEAADTRIFRPLSRSTAGDLVWIGNWGDGEREEELREFLIEPVRALGLHARVYGVRYPPHALAMLAEAGIEYGGWLPNYRVPEIFAQFRATVHVPRRPYAAQLPGIPTIRPFEALACGIPLISAPWNDSEALFTPGEDYLVAADGAEMRQQLARVLADEDLSNRLARHGLASIRRRHTCAHRVDELFSIVEQTPWSAAGLLRPDAATMASRADQGVCPTPEAH